MNCVQCEGKLRRGKAFYIDKNGYHLVMDAVPAWVCTRCAEIYFEDKSVYSIQKVLHALDLQTLKFAKTAARFPGCN